MRCTSVLCIARVVRVWGGVCTGQNLSRDIVVGEAHCSREAVHGDPVPSRGFPVLHWRLLQGVPMRSRSILMRVPKKYVVFSS